jgi:hypothetical protein
MTHPAQHLRNVLSIYTNDFYGDPDHQAYVEHVFKTIHTNSLAPRTRVFIPSTQKGTTTQLIRALKYRIPVYYGQTREDLFSWEKVNHHLGYTKEHIPNNLKIISDTRFLISGPAKIMPLSPNEDSVEVIISHIWGVNLESDTTADYHTLVAHEPSWNFDKYYDRQVELFRLIIQSSVFTMNNEGRSGVDIQMPLIGAGCFLRALSTNDQGKCLVQIIRALFTVVNEIPHSVRLTLCVFNPNEFSNWLVPALQNKAAANPHFVVATGSSYGNVMNNVPDPKKTGRTSVVINAWDTHSFIGNGGNGDPSVDGMIVANAGNYNNHFRNTSLLHNVAFNPHLLQPQKWIRF